MPVVFPVHASYGYGTSVEFKEIVHQYDDLSYRRYKRSTAAHKIRSLRFEDLSQAEYDSIEAFFIARKQATGTDDQFYVYDPNAVDSVDLSGVSTTGRHLAIFLDPRIDFVRDGPCQYSGSLTVLFLN